MTGNARPHLGGLFNGSVPPERPRRIVGVPTPALSVAASPDASTDTSTAPETPAASDPRAWSVLESFDPVRAVEQYFAVLRALLDVNRDIAVACTKAVLSLPGRARLRR